jgi:uncharacterized membrane protein
LSQQNKLALAVVLLVVALIVIVFTYRRMNASPYPEISKEEQKAAQERIREGFKQGPPGRGRR